MDIPLEGLKEWLLEWNKPGTLGDVLPWLITSLVTVASVIVMYFHRRRQRRREQALQVTAWADELPGGGIVARVRNSSRDRVEQIVVMVAQPSLESQSTQGADDNAQLFAVGAIGPERSVDFPLAASVANQQPPLIRLYFRDRSGQAWMLHEGGKLSRRRRSVAAAFFSSVDTGRRAQVLDHSGTLGPNGEAVELADMPIHRIDVDPNDGNNVTISFLPPGATTTPATVAEMQKDNDSRIARAYLDADDRLVRLTICNLPADTRQYAFPRYAWDSQTYTVCFGRRTDSLEQLTDVGRIHSAWTLGGKHTPWGDLAYVAYDEHGHLLNLVIPRSNLMPGFVTTDMAD